MLNNDRGASRRGFLRNSALGLAGGATAAFSGAQQAQAAETNANVQIKDVHTMTVKGPRTYVYVRVVTKDGRYGIGEAYGSPGIAVAEQIQAIKPYLFGKNPLEIDKLFTLMGDDSIGSGQGRTDGSAHALMRAVSGIEMALWDLAGKILDVPVSVLLGGRFRQRTRVYDHSRPRDMMDKGACREWAAKVKAHPSGFTAHKIDFSRASARPTDDKSRPGAYFDPVRDPANRQLTTKEFRQIAQGLENCREAIGWDHDLMVHCHWDYDLNTAQELARISAAIKPLWLEDPMPVPYNDTWKRLTEQSPVTILTGENLWKVEDFAPFVVNQATHVVNPDLRNSGGFLEGKRIADFASVFNTPISVHGTGSQLYTYQVAQWAASIRDFLILETVTGEGGWMDQMLQLDGPYIKDGFVKVSDKPGCGTILNREVVSAHLAPGEQWWGDV